MNAVFVELPAFERHRERYLDDAALLELQLLLISNPEAGRTIQGTDGLRKVRFRDPRRSKGKRSGLRVIYYWWQDGMQFWLFTLYDKDELSDLTSPQRDKLRTMIKAELEARRKS